MDLFVLQMFELKMLEILRTEHTDISILSITRLVNSKHLKLQRRVLKTEATVQNKNDENYGLRKKIAKFEKQWQQHLYKLVAPTDILASFSPLVLTKYVHASSTWVIIWDLFNKSKILFLEPISNGFRFSGLWSRCYPGRHLTIDLFKSFEMKSYM